MKLKLSKDRKVTPKAKKNSNQWTPEIPNAFGLPAHISCPGKTAVCESICYAFRLEKAYSNVSKLLKHNWDLLQSCGDNVKAITSLLDDMIDEYVREHERVEKLRDAKYPKVFRIHWDGDFYSLAYARAWKKVIENHPDVQFWSYTRSYTPTLNVVPILSNISNLSLYLSTDEDNAKTSKRVQNSYPDVKVALLGNTFSEALVTVSDLTGRKAPKCPEQTGRYPLVLDNGQGACVECKLCINGTNNVLFSISKK